jgi:predicted neutral ceramidase superfamily lipid hydrolase
MRANTTSIAVVLIRAVSIYLVANGLSTSSRLLAIPGFWEEADTENKIMVISAVVTPFLVALVLWFSAKKLAIWMLPDANSTQVPGARVLVSAGTFLIGLFWAMTALQALIALYPYGYSKLYPWLILLAVSIGLMLGSNFISRCYGWLRTAGLSHNK